MHWADVSALAIAGFLTAFVLAFFLGVGAIAGGCDGICFDRLGYVLAIAVVAGVVVGGLLGFAAKRFANRNADFP